MGESSSLELSSQRRTTTRLCAPSLFCRPAGGDDSNRGGWRHRGGGGARGAKTAEQKVRIDLSVDGVLIETRPAMTDKVGRFVVQFLSRDRPSVAARLVGLDAEITESSVLDLAFQRQIIYASVLAPADSNVVHYQYPRSDPGIPK